MNMIRRKPVTLLAIAHAVLGVALAFHLIEWDGGQLAAVEGLFAALGFTASGQVTANVHLDPEVVAREKGRRGWSGRLTDDAPADDLDV